MVNSPFLALEGVSFVLPDGRVLFSDLHERFDLRHTALIGNNGTGKTALARIMAGRLQPSSGCCVSTGIVHYVDQQVSRLAGASVASLAGVQDALDALTRIEAGSAAVEDFDAVAERWDLRERFQSELRRHGLGHLDASTGAPSLSGGEAMRVALIGAWLSQADFLILDEPSNHLDRPSRHELLERLRHWPRGLMVISHDRQLLDAMERVVELSPESGLQTYGGNYTFYARCKAQERHSALELLKQRKLERQRQERVMHEQHERQERRQARGRQDGHDANQARILLSRRKENGEVSTGKLRQQHVAARERLDRQVREAAQRTPDDAVITLHALPVIQVAQRIVVELEAVRLPFVQAATRDIDLMLSGRQRVGVVGPNGCGKSTLLRLMVGRLQPLAGACRIDPERAYLDQRLDDLDPRRPVLEQLQRANPRAAESDLRMRLAQIGLDAARIGIASGLLSGGERLKAALACVLYADPPPRLLLLDEPSNHLDLSSTLALESMLRGYPGALIVVSHDDAFLDRLDLTDRLLATASGWRMTPC